MAAAPEGFTATPTAVGSRTGFYTYETSPKAQVAEGGFARAKPGSPAGVVPRAVPGVLTGPIYGGGGSQDANHDVGPCTKYVIFFPAPNLCHFLSDEFFLLSSLFFSWSGASADPGVRGVNGHYRHLELSPDDKGRVSGAAGRELTTGY